jgi:hypothetical protein
MGGTWEVGRGREQSRMGDVQVARAPRGRVKRGRGNILQSWTCGRPG